MNYYEHHLGDYAKDTAHLTMIEHGAYRLLLDRYYGTEAGIPADQVYRVARARSKEEKAAVEVVLEEFFELVDGVWKNKRAEEEIEKFLASKPKADEKRENDKERQRRARERRKALFEELSGLGVHMPFNSTTDELYNAIVRAKSHPSHDNVTQPVTRDNTLTQTPDPSHQTPEVKTHTTVPTVAGAVCVALRSEGMAQVNPSHPELLTLLEQGAKIEEFVNAGRIAREKGKGFAYVLGIVKGQLADAKRMAEEAANGLPITTRKVKDPPWWISEQSINAKAATLGLRARPGEDMANFKGRIEEAIRKSEGATA